MVGCKISARSPEEELRTLVFSQATTQEYFLKFSELQGMCENSLYGLFRPNLFFFFGLLADETQPHWK